MQNLELRVYHPHNGLNNEVHAWANNEGIPRERIEHEVFEAGKSSNSNLPTKDLLAQGLSEYPFLADILDVLPQEKSVRLITGLNNWAGIQNSKERGIFRTHISGNDKLKSKDTNVSILEDIFKKKNSSYLNDPTYRYNIKEKSYQKLFKHEVMYDLLSGLLGEPQKYRFQIAALLTQLSSKKMSKQLQEELRNTVTNFDMHLQMSHKHWTLCEDAEPRMNAAVDSEAVILVNERLLVKVIGKLSALCLDTFSTKRGETFYEGVWYSPTDDETRHKLHEAHDIGKSRLTINGGSWALMRAVLDKDMILSRSQAAAKSLPETTPFFIGRQTRREYRLYYQELL